MQILAGQDRVRIVSVGPGVDPRLRAATPEVCSTGRLLLGPLGNASRPPYDPGPQLEPSQARPWQTPLVGAALVLTSVAAEAA